MTGHHTPRRRRVSLVAITALTSLLAASSWFLASQIASPEQLAAQAEPPPPSIVVADVERRQLSRTVNVRGEIVAAKSIAVSLLANDSPLATATGTPVTDGDTANEGSVLVAVNGRPIIALVGALGMYRDLRPGQSGPDVEQLNSALIRLGYRGETADRRAFTAETIAGVGDLYRDLGFEPLTTSDTLSAERAQLVQAVSDGKDALAAARIDRQKILAGPDALDVASADAAVDSARRSVDAAKAQQQSEERASTQAIMEARSTVTDLEASKAPESDIAEAKKELERVQSEADVALRAAADAVADTASSLELAELSRKSLAKGGDTADADRLIASLDRQIQQSQQALSDFDATEGIMVPVSELVFMPLDAMLVTQFSVEVGTQIDVSGDTPLMVLVDDELTFESFVSSNKVAEISVGTPVISLDESRTPGSVIDVAGEPQVDPDTGNFGFPIAVVFDTQPDVTVLGEELEVDIVVESIDDALVVPISAVYSNSDESIYVLRSKAATSYDQVPVTIDLVSDGWVAVTPSRQGALSGVDQVVVSR